ncbi:XRE family transcriptional regulator [Rothia sp. AR01]|uniref:XRE family transcriptional regulator n=1 Tax=Rothia santali TaxID=2949643 RepID=A0A9X2HJU1_9MICC|nr:XRE family transcriptional regulator [Rothia santali]MCP3425593.1 XRE family transcriptional regulator [Rothia santali]
MDAQARQAATVYEVIAHREVHPEASFWVFEIPALGAVGQATKLSAVEEEARGIITAWDEDGPAEEDIGVSVRLDGEAEARRIWDEGEEEERAARAALDHAGARKREAVSMLRETKHYSAAETARVLGVTRQRVYQLAR